VENGIPFFFKELHFLSGFRHGTGAPPIPRWEANRWRKPVEIFQIPKIAPSPAEGLGAFEPKAKKA
jgi:hypothetical protein